MSPVIRLFTGLPGAFLITVSIFLLLASVIAQNQDVQLSDDISIQINISRQIEDRSQQRMEDFQRPVLDQPPPPPPVVTDPSFRPTMGGTAVEAPNLGAAIEIGTGFNPDRDAQPLVRIPPQYPQRCQARARAVETVLVEFDVTPEGTVIDPRVIETSNSCFNRAAMRAVEQWRYQPRIVDGAAQPRFGVRTPIDFVLE